MQIQDLQQSRGVLFKFWCIICVRSKERERIAVSIPQDTGSLQNGLNTYISDPKKK